MNTVWVPEDIPSPVNRSNSPIEARLYPVVACVNTEVGITTLCQVEVTCAT
jgi:hypothetical protein